jgi:hypothetical protein
MQQKTADIREYINTSDQGTSPPDDGNTVSIGNVSFTVVKEHCLNLMVVDVSDLIAKAVPSCNGSYDNKEYPSGASDRIELTTQPDWEVDKHALIYAGAWVAYAREPDSLPRGNWTAYFDDGEWKVVLTSGLRPDDPWKIRTPFIIGEHEDAYKKYGDMYLPAMSYVYWNVALPPHFDCHDKCSPWSRDLPTVTFVAHYGKNGTKFSDGLLQLGKLA